MVMAGLWIDCRDDPVFGHPAGDAKDAVVTLCEVLADDSGERRCRLCDHRVEHAPVEDHQGGVGVFGPGIDKCLTGYLVVPVDHRLARTRVVIAALEHTAQREGELWVRDLEQSPDG